VLSLALVGATVAALVWRCVHDPKITFLPGDRRAEWVVFPAAPYAGLHPIVELEVVFRREFTLDRAPGSAWLNIRAARRFAVAINGQAVDVRPGRNWKEITGVEVARHLRGGTNTIEARVRNDNGPPALWLELAGEGLRLRSDGRWECSATESAWCQAAEAKAPRLPGPGNLMAGGEETPGALRAVWPLWALWGGLAAGFWLWGRRWFNRLRAADAVTAGRWSNGWPGLLLLIIAVFWVILFVNNARLLQRVMGFDGHAHISYIEYIQKHRALPLPNEGLEMFQPPLYYGISAGLLSLFGLTTTDAAGIVVLRLFTTLLGIVHVTLVFLSLRLLFPGQTGRQGIGLLLAAFLPMHLYLSQYVTNETLAAMLVSASVYLCLRLFAAEKNPWTGFIVLGLVMGAACLAKFTAVLAVPFLVGALAGRLLARGEPAGTALLKLGGMLGIAALVSGWHYVRLWRQMGSMVIGGWDPASGLAWWQDDGYRVAAYYERFGVSLVRPWFSGTASFMDGIYSTLWGDGLCGGSSGLTFRPPWNYNLMCAGYLLAVWPTVLVLAGAAAWGLKWLRTGGADRFVLLGVAFAVGIALVYLSLTVPYYAAVKAFFGLCALVPFCVFGAVGWDVLTRGRKGLQFALGLVLVVWALNSFVSVWVRSRSASTHVYLGTAFFSEGKNDAALTEFNRAMSLDPADAQAKWLLAAALNDSGNDKDALELAGQALKLDPANAIGHRILSTILFRRGQFKLALDEARRAVELGPEYLPARRLVVDCLVKVGSHEEAIDVARNGLVVSPWDPDLHFALGMELAQKDDFADAANQFEYALVFHPAWVEAHLNLGQALLYLGNGPAGLRHLRAAMQRAPDSPVVLNKLAWELATNPDAALRSGPEAVRLAEHACAVAGRRNPLLLDTLAAAYAEAGRFPEAVDTAREALALARSAGNQTTIERTESLLALFQSGRPFHERLPASP
jgi:tetratricopeptide (TPR) repeat protein